MMDRDSSIRPTPFTQTELVALQALRVRTRTTSRLVTDGEPAYRRFLRRLARRLAWGRALNHPSNTQGVKTTAARAPATDAWLSRLKAGYDAGYYRTEPALGAQTPFPWQNKACKDCPLWSIRVCRVFAEYRHSMAHTCMYFDPWNRQAAQALIQQRRESLHRHWWGWFRPVRRLVQGVPRAE